MARTLPAIDRRVFLGGALSALAAPYALQAGPAGAAARSAASLGPLINIPQTYNNCGPAAIAEVLAYWGINRTQAEVRAVLRVDGPLTGMTVYGVPSYARAAGLRALVGMGGTEQLVKLMVAAGFPIVVHQVVSLSDSTGHWRPMQSYDDRQGSFVTSDPYLGPGYTIGYDAFAQMWAQRGYGFFVLYPARRQAALTAVLRAAGWNKTAAYTMDLARVRSYQWDVTPTSAPAGSGAAYHYLALAWDSAQLGRSGEARAYLRQATQAGANPSEVHWINAEIR